MSKIQNQIKTDLNEAMKKKDQSSILTFRGLLSAIHNKEIELKKKELTDEEAILDLETQAKQRRDSMAEFEKAGRADLVEKEKDEFELIAKYLPVKIPGAEVEKIVDQAIKSTGASGRQDVGKVMGEVMKLGKGKIDGAKASEMVKKKLSK
ncbi:MAG: hypothetical protein CEN92_139 [Candidatus Berkelbacteria bacterium Licking1014_96]|uniref:GatB/YqeY domain-containing protein n=1 Tax=Candidatus Berkelbacteria bacterium Licking1014_96 TaxID=2017149 RepID=A0A554LGV0_9BACT|nr:MAG: hypothetical protein CEN92_139 [Candidatus Berkelbacteria bacterium Licking1014_96]